MTDSVTEASDTFDAVLAELAGELERTHPALVAARRFSVEERLGEGGFGAVYGVRDEETGRPLAVKVLRRRGPYDLLRFKREFRALAEVRHPNLVRLDRLLQVGEHWMLTMERVEGVPLDVFIAEHPSTLRDTFRQLIEGVAALHEAGKLHRDLKPSNVLVEANGRVVVLDFGLVRDIDAQESTVLAGTPAYMSPEQGAESRLGPPTDWYAVGVMLYEVLTGGVPFVGPVLEVLRRKREELPEPLGSDVDERLARLVMRLLSAQPEMRPNVTELAAFFGAEAHRPLTATFLGQEAEWGELERGLAAVEEGEAVAAFLTITATGSQTVGLRRFGERAAAAGALVLYTRCSERESLPLNALDGLVDALVPHLRALHADHPALARDALAPLARQFPVLRELAPARVSSEAPGNPEVLGRELLEVLDQLAADRPVVVLIDRLEHADALSHEAVGALLTTESSSPLFFALSAADDVCIEALRRRAARHMRVMNMSLEATPSSRRPSGPPELTLEPGQRITPHLRLVSPLGEGGMGAVWVARDTKLDRDVAVKFVSPALASRGSVFLERFRREAKVLAKVVHPHVVQVYDYGVLRDELPFVVMELLEGETLEARLDREGPMTPDDVVTLIDHIVDGLTAAHERGVIHRDVKPANLFLVDAGTRLFTKIIDFGVAKMTREVDGTTMTASGSLVGTPVYMSPEPLFDREPASRATDTWSVAVVAYRCLTGHLPFAGKTVADLGRLMAQETWRAPSDVVPALPRTVDGVFRRAFAMEPGDRYASLGEWAEELRAALQLDAGSVVAPPPGSRGRMGMVALGVLASMGGAYALATSDDRTPSLEVETMAAPFASEAVTPSMSVSGAPTASVTVSSVPPPAAASAEPSPPPPVAAPPPPPPRPSPPTSPAVCADRSTAFVKDDRGHLVLRPECR